MKNHLYKVFLAFVVFLFCFGAPSYLRAGELSVTDDPILEEYTELARTEFFQNYTALWEQEQLDKRIVEAAKKSVTAHIEKLFFGTRNIQLCINTNDILDAIREDVLSDFLPYYEKFSADFQKGFTDAWSSISKSAYGTMVTELIKEKDSVSQIFLRIFTGPMLSDDETPIDKNVVDLSGVNFDYAAIKEKAPHMEPLGLGGYGSHIFSDIPARVAGDFCMDLNDYFAKELVDTYWRNIAQNIRKGLSAVLSEREMLLSELEKLVAEPKVRELQQEFQQVDKKEYKALRAKAAEIVENYLVKRP